MKRRQKISLLSGVGIGGVLAARVVARGRRALDWHGKVVLITGGSRGLGLIMARQLAAEGARLAICARDTKELERARVELEGRGAQVLAVPCDVTDKEQVDAMVHRVREHFGTIDVLVNNAGIIQAAPFEVMALEEYDEAMKLHFWAPLYATLAVLPEMRRKGSGRIVNISSFGGKVSVPHMVPYCASKFALTGLSEGMRAELAKDGILVTTICPNLMRTGSLYHAIFKGRHRAEYTLGSIFASIPLFSMNAERAARQIINACKMGDGTVVLSKRAQIAVTLANLFPGLTADALSLVSRALPSADGPDSIGAQRATGRESTSPLSPSPLTILTEVAAQRHNETVS